MTDKHAPEQIAGKLTKAQRTYLEAVDTCGGEYHARHGVTANWALRHGYVQMMIHLPDGSVVPWNSLPPLDRYETDYAIGGQMLTETGEAVRAILRGEV